jgi:hypothetical protein
MLLNAGPSVDGPPLVFIGEHTDVVVTSHLHTDAREIGRLWAWVASPQ